MSATDALTDLRQRRAALQTSIRGAETATRFASVDVETASEELAGAERRRLAGTGSAADVAVAEKRLAKARQARTGDVSHERLRGARQALHDLDREITEFAQAHYGELL